MYINTIYILIESQWNLNVVPTLLSSFHLLILIESQWNLNGSVMHRCCPECMILIESQWNLNKRVGGIYEKIYEYINRITVEFKLHHRGSTGG